VKDRKERLGQKGDMDEIFSHPFMQGLDLEKLLNKELEAPFKPEIEYSSMEQAEQQKMDGFKESMISLQGRQKILLGQAQFASFGVTRKESI